MIKFFKYIQFILEHNVIHDKDININLFISLIRRIYGDDILIFKFDYLEKIENFLTRPDNFDLIKKLFSNIDKNSDIIVSGSFGKYIFNIIDNLDFDGNVILVNGSIRKVMEDKDNKVEIIDYRYRDIKNKKFIFVDDSFVKGGTRDRINEFLSKYNSEIVKTYTFYTHYKMDKNDVFSFYCYGKSNLIPIPIHKSLDKIKNINLFNFKNILIRKIDLGEITNLNDLVKTIIKLDE
jgi:phosphoribosylpyrophosphate synthetase